MCQHKISGLLRVSIPVQFSGPELFLEVALHLIRIKIEEGSAGGEMSDENAPYRV